MSSRATRAPITIALLGDYNVALAGIERMLARYRDRVHVHATDIDSNEAMTEPVDVVLFDSFAQPGPCQDAIAVLTASPHARRVAVYTWNFHPDLIAGARKLGVHGYLSKTLPACDLVTALEALHAGHRVFHDPPPRARSAPGLEWPGRREGLTDREAEILAMITQGRNNAEIADLTYLSPNTIKSYIRAVYRKIDVASRTRAVLWGVTNGFTPDHHRIEPWRAAGGRGMSATL